VSRPGSDETALAERLGHGFADPALLDEALTHPSAAFERDEFLGDAVLDLSVARLLFDAHPDWAEGELTRARAALVNAGALADRARALGLGAHLRLGRTEERSGGADKESILANAFEAVLGAVYLDAGLDAVTALVQRLFAEALADPERALRRDPKTRFQEWAHAVLHETPRYRLLRDSGVEDAADRFTVAVEVAGECWGEATARTKREAERGAAVVALARAEARPDG